MIFAPFIILILALIGYLLYRHYSVAIKRIGFIRSSRKFWSEWDCELQQNFDPYSRMSPDEKEKLLKKMSVLYHEKRWANTVSRGNRILICARGAIPILHRKTNYYPSVTVIASDESGYLWYRELQKQFEFEQGKIVDRSFKTNFCRYCDKFFYEPKSVKEIPEKKRERLKSFFGFSPFHL